MGKLLKRAAVILAPIILKKVLNRYSGKKK